MSKLLSGDDPNKVSLYNSTNTPLIGSATFTGGWEEVYQYNSITVICKTDQIGTLYADFSTDAIDTTKTVQLTDGTSVPNGECHNLITKARFFRLRFVNGATPQTTFKIQTIYSLDAKITQTTSRLNDQLNPYEDVLLTRSILTGTQPNGVTYENVGTCFDGALNVDTPRTLDNISTVSNYTTTFQASTAYGNRAEDFSDVVRFGSITEDGRNLKVALDGTGGVEVAQLRTRKFMKFSPGQTMIVRISGYIEDPTSFVDCQGAFSASGGLGEGTVGFINNSFGGFYIGFGILSADFDLRTGIYKLELSGGFDTTSHTITLADDVINVTTALATSLNQLAIFITADSQFSEDGSSDWLAYSNENVVTFVRKTVVIEAGTSSSYVANNGTTSGVVTTLVEGFIDQTQVQNAFIPQALWNIDVCDGSSSQNNPSGFNLDITKMNFYQMEIFHFGQNGHVRYSIYDNNLGRFIPVHTQKTAQVFLSVAGLVGIGGDVAVNGPRSMHVNSFYGAIQGLNIPFRSTDSFSHTRTANTSETVSFMLRNAPVFRGKNNFRQLILKNITAVIDTSQARTVQINIYRNPVVTGGDIVWSWIDEQESAVEQFVPTAGTVITASNGRLLQTLAATGGSSFNLKLDDLVISRAETLAITIRTLSNTGDTFIALNFVEDG